MAFLLFLWIDEHDTFMDIFIEVSEQPLIGYILIMHAAVSFLSKENP